MKKTLTAPLLFTLRSPHDRNWRFFLIGIKADKVLGLRRISFGHLDACPAAGIRSELVVRPCLPCSCSCRSTCCTSTRNTTTTASGYYLNRTFGGGQEVLSHPPCSSSMCQGCGESSPLHFIWPPASRSATASSLFTLLWSTRVVHIVAAVAPAPDNPGLGTAVFLFLPVGVFGLRELHGRAKSAGNITCSAFW